jgi:hypothetical protein
MLVAALTTALLAAGAAVAQDESSADAAIARAEENVQRIDTHVECMLERQRELEETIRLMREARAQLRAATGDARRDAASAVESLSQRAAGVMTRLSACPPPPSGTGPRTTDDGRPIVERQAPRHPTDDAVAIPNDPTRVIERNTRLTSSVRVDVGEQVDGFGRVDSQAIRSAVAAIGSRLESCYGELVDRTSARTGTAILSFRVNGNGRTTGIAVLRPTLGDARFRSCLTQAASRLRVTRPSTGGDAEFSYTLAFGP